MNGFDPITFLLGMLLGVVGVMAVVVWVLVRSDGDRRE